MRTDDETRVLVFGGRHYENREHVWRVLDEVHEARGLCLVVHGDCTIGGRRSGADQHADTWCMSRGVQVARFPANFAHWGLQGGPIRNRAMPYNVRLDLGIGFPGGRGTADMERVLRACGIELRLERAL